MAEHSWSGTPLNPPGPPRAPGPPYRDHLTAGGRGDADRSRFERLDAEAMRARL